MTRLACLSRRSITARGNPRLGPGRDVQDQVGWERDVSAQAWNSWLLGVFDEAPGASSGDGSNGAGAYLVVAAPVGIDDESDAVGEPEHVAGPKMVSGG